MQRAPGAVDRCPGLDAAPALDAAAAGLAAGDLLARARGAVPALAPAPAAGRTRWSSATWGTSTCCSPGGSSPTCRWCSTTWSVPVTRQPTAAWPAACGSGCCAGWTPRRWAPPTSSWSTPTSTGTRCPRPTAGARWSCRSAPRRPGTPTRARRRTPAEPLRAVFFGLFTPLQGAPVIGAALAALADDEDHPVEVTMIGSGQDLDETRALAARNPRVHWLDWVDAADLPAMVAAHDLCLGIFGTGPKATAGGAQQGVPGRRRRLRAGHLGHRAAAPGARRRRRARARRATRPRWPRRCADLAADRSRLAAARAAAARAGPDVVHPGRRHRPAARPPARRRTPEDLHDRARPPPCSPR